MGDEIDGIKWIKQWQGIVEEYYDTPEEAKKMADKIGVFANVSTDIEEVETSF